MFVSRGESPKTPFFGEYVRTVPWAIFGVDRPEKTVRDSSFRRRESHDLAPVEWACRELRRRDKVCQCWHGLHDKGDVLPVLSANARFPAATVAAAKLREESPCETGWERRLALVLSLRNLSREAVSQDERDGLLLSAGRQQNGPNATLQHLYKKATPVWRFFAGMFWRSL